MNLAAVLRWSLLLVLVLACSCAYYEDRAAEKITEVGKLMAPVDERIIHGDDEFTGHEREAFEAGLIAWAQFTRGRVRLHVIWDLDGTNYLTLRPALFRVLPNDMHDGRAGAVEGDSIWWAPEACPDKQACAEHEVGHFLGLCVFPRPHVPYTNNVMSATNPSRNFGYGDWRECLYVGVCKEPRPDVTVVTVTVDPTMPNPSLEYPK